MGGDNGVGPPPLKRLKLSIPTAKAVSGDSLVAILAPPMAKDMPADDGVTIGSRGQIRKLEFVRIITQALSSLGYKHAATALEEESGVPLQLPVVSDFRREILAGLWDESITTLHKITWLDDETVKLASFLILQQKFLEFLDSGDTSSALKTLRSEISLLGINTHRVHELASFVMCPSREALSERADWRGGNPDSRVCLLEQLQNLLPPALMIPENRLEHLVEQALEVQRKSCLFHNSSEHLLSLYTDHRCSRDQIPTRTLQMKIRPSSVGVLVQWVDQNSQVLEAHENEVWFLQFSHNGRYLASASKDLTAILWEVVEDGLVKLRHILKGHQKAVSFVAWSPDDTMLLTCGNEESVKLWDTSTGECRHTFNKPNSCFTSCAWFPDGNRFVSGGGDKSIYMWDLEGQELESWKGARMPRINDLAITVDGSHMVSICADKDIRIYNLEEKSERVIEEEKPITSLSVSKDGRYLLVNLVSQEIHLWDIAVSSKLLFKYRGHRQGRYVIRSCFGGSDHAFIVSGSEDSQVYIWHRQNGELLEVLPGHSGTVNSVSWNPVNPHMFASASDDHTIRIWGLTTNIDQKNPNVGAANGIDHLENGGTRELLENLKPFY